MVLIDRNHKESIALLRIKRCKYILVDAVSLLTTAEGSLNNN